MHKLELPTVQLVLFRYACKNTLPIVSGRLYSNTVPYNFCLWKFSSRLILT